jgi:sec-independent protein translocase protein TatB
MFDISWSELLILGIVTLVFVGPKELPVFLRTLGRYTGMVRRHANEFKAQFDAAMREAELESMRKEVEQMQSSINAEVMKAKSSINDAASASRIDAAPAPAAATASPASPASPTPPLPAPASEMAGPQPAPSAIKTES